MSKFILWSFALTVFALVSTLGYSVGDYALAKETTGKGTVIGKKYTEDKGSIIIVNDMVVPLSPQGKWGLYIKRSGPTDSGYVEVPQEIYNSVTDGTQVTISYSVGRWSKELHISAVHIH